MPGFDGTGPSGQGPMSGQGRGFCVLRSSEKSPHQLQGFAGLRGVPVRQTSDNVENPGNRVEEESDLVIGNRFKLVLSYRKDGYYAKKRWYRAYGPGTRHGPRYGSRTR